MLVLTRKKNGTIVVGDDVEIVVIDIQEGKVRLGVRAPIDIPVHRGEVYAAIQREKGETEVAHQ